MKARVNFDVEHVENQRHRLGAWLDETEAGEMDGEEMIGYLADIIAELEDQLSVLRRAVG